MLKSTGEILIEEDGEGDVERESLLSAGSARNNQRLPSRASGNETASMLIAGGGGGEETHTSQLHHRSTSGLAEEGTPSSLSSQQDSYRRNRTGGGIIVLSAPQSNRKKREAELKRRIAGGFGVLVLACLLLLLASGTSTRRNTKSIQDDLSDGAHPLAAQGVAAHSSSTDDSSAASSSEEEEHEDAVDAVKAEKQKKHFTFAVVGERHSGVEFWNSTLQKCFASSSSSDTIVTVRDGINRPSPFFQQKPKTDSQQKKQEKQDEDLFVLATFLNPYDWIEEMRVTPTYAYHEHYDNDNNSPLDWNDFVTKRWSMSRPSRDIRISKTKEIQHSCQFNFTYDEIIPCIRSTSKRKFSAYEMKPTTGNKPFSSILKLRKAKIQHFLDIESWPSVSSYLKLPYENLSHSGEIIKIVKMIGRLTNLPHDCEDITKRTVVVMPEERKLPSDYVKHITNELDWEMETKLGFYHPMKTADKTSKHKKNNKKKKKHVVPTSSSSSEDSGESSTED